MDPTAVIIAVAGLVCTVGSFIAGQKSGAKNDGRQLGEIFAKLDILKESLDELKDSFSNSQGEFSALKDRQSRTEARLDNVESSLARAHKRIDEMGKP